MTFAASETETVGPAVVVTAEELWAALTVGSLTFGCSLPGVADPLDGVDEALFGDDTSSLAELGATSAGDGATVPTDADGEALVAAGADEADGALVTGLGEAAVEATDGSSEAGGATTRGAGDSDSTFVTGGLAVVGDAGATGVTTGAVVVCVTTGGGGATGSTGSTACCVCGGASKLGAAGRIAGAFGGACCAGASVSSATGTFGSGAGAVVVTT
jgi:hypothetical protein